MSVVEYRAWDKIDKIMIDWNCMCQTAFNCQSVHQQKNATLLFEPMIYRILLNHNDRFILEQYTSFEDKNNKKIFDGDKVKVEYRLNGSIAIGIVEMIDGCWMVSFKKFEERPFCPATESYRNQDYLKMFMPTLNNSCEVIGHIHENFPELKNIEIIK